MPEELVLDLNGYEGPIDLLLSLARDRKIDLSAISVSALADQYLAFIANAKDARLEIAAEYLVMAAWLAYLKSRLLLPREPLPSENPSADQMAATPPAGSDASCVQNSDGPAPPRARMAPARHAGGAAGEAGHPLAA